MGLRSRSWTFPGPPGGHEGFGMIAGWVGVMEPRVGADGFCHLQGDMGPTGPKGATGTKGERVSMWKCLGGVGKVKVVFPDL